MNDKFKKPGEYDLVLGGNNLLFFPILKIIRYTCTSN